MEEINVTPQFGFQTAATDCPADIAIIGGSAGCGKSWALLFEPIKYLTRDIPGFNGIIFRRESVQISTTGGLLDKMKELYRLLPPGVQPEFAAHQARFPGNATIQLNHLHFADSVYGFQGAEICYLAFDELTHFLEEQFFYMLSRNRSTCGVQPYVRASTNPQGDGWVKRLIQWWLYPDDHPVEILRGLPIPERQGQLRYMARFGGVTLFGDSPDEILSQLPDEAAEKLPREAIRTLTFVAGKLAENRELLKVNPGYLGNLMALSDSERVKLLDGRWIDFEQDESRLYTNAAISDIFSNTFVQKSGERFITADIALEGSDRFVIAIWNGWVLVELRTVEKSMGNEVLAQIERAAKDWRVPTRNIAFDSGGVGGFLKGFLKTAYPFLSGNAPIIEGKVSKVHGPTSNRPAYFNLRSQVFFELRERIENCELLIENCPAAVQQIIEAELRAIKKMELGSDQKLRIIPKDQIRQQVGHSPDYADVLAMRCVFDLIPRIQHRRERPVH